MAQFKTTTIELGQGSIDVRDSGGTGDPLVFVHGLFVDGTLWEDMLPLLADSHRCIVPDLPLGSHRAAMRPDADLSPPALGDMLAATLDALGIDRATLVGSDTGGAISQIAAARHPDRFPRLILTPCDTHENFLPPAFRPLQWAARVPAVVRAGLALTRFGAMRRSPLAYGPLVKRRPQPDDRYARWTRPARTDAGVRRDLVAVLRGIDTRHLMAATDSLIAAPPRTLIIWTREDRFFTPAEAERLAAEIAGSEITWVSDAKTFVQIDQPGVVAELIADFCARSAVAVAPV